MRTGDLGARSWPGAFRARQSVVRGSAAMRLYVPGVLMVPSIWRTVVGSRLPLWVPARLHYHALHSRYGFTAGEALLRVPWPTINYGLLLFRVPGSSLRRVLRWYGGDFRLRWVLVRTSDLRVHVCRTVVQKANPRRRPKRWKCRLSWFLGREMAGCRGAVRRVSNVAMGGGGGTHGFTRCARIPPMAAALLHRVPRP